MYHLLSQGYGNRPPGRGNGFSGVVETFRVVSMASVAAGSAMEFFLRAVKIPGPPKGPFWVIKHVFSGGDVTGIGLDYTQRIDIIRCAARLSRRRSRVRVSSLPPLNRLKSQGSLDKEVFPVFISENFRAPKWPPSYFEPKIFIISSSHIALCNRRFTSAVSTG